MIFALENTTYVLNQETFEKVKETYPEVFATSGESYWEQQLKAFVKDVK